MPSTLRELVLCASPLAQGTSTIREHLLATDCDDMGGGTPIDVPYYAGQLEFSVEPIEESFSVEPDDIYFGIGDEIYFGIEKEEVHFSVRPVDVEFSIEECK